MKVTTAGVLRRLDLTPAIGLLPALFQQWNDLQFDHSGNVAEAPSDSVIAQLVLTEGRHRQAGARYAVTIERPAPAPDREHQSQSTAIVVMLKHDDSRSIAATISDERRSWTVDAEIGRERLPTIDLMVRVDLIAASLDVTTRRIARLLGERGEGRATIDLGTIEGEGGAFVDARGRLNRFRGRARAELDTGPASWSVDATLSVVGRGFGRVVMLLARRLLRRHVESRMQQFWQKSDVRIARAESALRELAVTVQREGGETAFVHRALRGPRFGPRPPAAPD